MTIESEILETMRAWDAALLANDAPAVASFMADDWIFVGPGGIATRAEITGHIAAGGLTHTAFEAIGEERIVIRSVVLVTGRRRAAGTWDGVPYTTDEWLSEVYENVDGLWLCVLSHKADAK